MPKQSGCWLRHRSAVPDRDVALVQVSGQAHHVATLNQEGAERGAALQQTEA